MDAATVGQYAKPLDTVHTLSYFSPLVAESLVDAGLEAGRMCYFASRSAAMGEVTAPVVAASFYNFNPVSIAESIPRAWALCSPEEIVAARVRGVDAAMRAVLGDRLVESSNVAEAADLAATAALSAAPDGRPLFAAHAGLTWPEEPHLRLWHALTLLREYRGDGHTGALMTVGLSGLEALITHTATERGFVADMAMALRGWSQEQWDGAAAGLRDRDLLDGAGLLTELGTEVRQAVEELTDDLSLAPWEALGDDGFERLGSICHELHTTIMASGVFPRSAFGASWANEVWPE